MNNAPVQLRHLIDIYSGKDYQHAQNDAGQYPVYGSGGEYARATDYMFEGTAVLFGRKGTIDRPQLVSGKFWVADTAYCAFPKSGIDVRFLFYLAQTIPYDLYSTSTALPSMTRSDIASHKAIVPDVVTQRKISDYLDHETAQIDTLVEKTERFIKLLEERRAAMIAHVVTKGLDPNAKLVDSGVEWIGMVPEGWDTVKAKQLLHVRKERAQEYDDIVTCFRDGEVTLRKNRRTVGFTEAEKEHGYQRIYAGDLVVHSMDAFGGSVGVSDSTGKSTPVYIACIPNDATVNVYYYALLIRQMGLNGWIQALAKGIRQRSTDFRWDALKEQRLPVPPAPVQTEVVREVERRSNDIRVLIQKQRQQISLLKERRSALISHAVTQGI